MIAECLARPLLVDRLIRDRYARDARLHADLRARAERALAAEGTVAGMRRFEAVYREEVWIREDEAPNRAARGGERRLAAEAWHRAVAPLEALPAGVVGPLQEDDDRFFAVAVLDKAPRRIRVAFIDWPKPSFGEWWAEEVAGAPQAGVETAAAGDFSLPQIAITADPGSWTPTFAGAADAREKHIAVWTGTEMIVWGGEQFPGFMMASGARYSPATDSWVPTSNVDTPSPRDYMTAVWTGTEMIVWGGWAGATAPENTGGRYDPVSDIWMPTSTGLNVPEGRQYHTAVWTGTEMIIWGGYAYRGEGEEGYYLCLDSGGRYRPSNDSWQPVSTGSGVPSARCSHTAVWTGSLMIVWGGRDPVVQLNTGGRYDPVQDQWSPTSAGAYAPEGRSYHIAVWTGSLMIVWGGSSSSAALDTGAKYNPSADAWWPMSPQPNTPSPRTHHTAVWTPEGMIVWGGWNSSGTLLNTAGRYEPGDDYWYIVPIGSQTPSARILHTAVWTGTEMIVWGGYDGPRRDTRTGGRFDPGANSWSPTATGVNVPAERERHTAVWTGVEMIVWGGSGFDSYNSGGRYDPATDSWVPTAVNADTPCARNDHRAVWTGTDMIVWGGLGWWPVPPQNTGGRYNPITDSWTATSTGAGVPEARGNFTAVWTGQELVIWGGWGVSGQALNTGARYLPSYDVWTPTSTTDAPTARDAHSAVWSGNEMIVWGGYVYSDVTPSAANTGGRYNPLKDEWDATSLGPGLPEPRGGHLAVWTGKEMILWGGGYPGGTGGQYDSYTDTWTPTGTGPGDPDVAGTAVWTGDEMIVWGGDFFRMIGSRYDPVSKSWQPTEISRGVPSARVYHTAVATPGGMIVWGGLGDTATGAVYSTTCTTKTWYRDADQDGHGDADATMSACVQPIGCSSLGDDPNDANPDVYPGAPEICDSLDNDGDGTTDGPAPAATPDLWARTEADGMWLSWSPLPGVVAYDVQQGSLTALLATGGQFSSATLSCLAADDEERVLRDAEMPDPASGFYYVARGQNCGGNGTYDDGQGSGQQGARDAGIAASPAACP